MSKVSVIVPSFNQAPYITDCLKSIFAQTKKDYEVIVVDDHSTDNTAEVIKPYLTKIKFIQNKKNFGAFSYTANIGIKHATGDYILVVSADDWLAENILEEESALLAKNPNIGLVYSESISVTNGKKTKRTAKPAGNKSYIGRPNDFHLLLTQGDFIPSLNALVRKSVYEKVGLFDTNLKYMVDYEMWIRIAETYPLAYIAKPLTFYRAHGNNLHLNADFQKRNEVEFEYILNKYLMNRKLDKHLQNTKAVALHGFYLKICANAIFEGNSKRALSFWLKAFKKNPLSIFSWKTIQPWYFAARESLKKLRN